MRKKILLAVILHLAVVVPSIAQSKVFKPKVADGFSYEIVSEGSRTIQVVDGPKTGDVVIKQTVTSYDNFDYTVVRAIGLNWNGSNITSLSFPATVEYLSYFQNCPSLTSVTIPAATTLITEQTFNGCNSLENIDVESENTAYKDIDGVLYNKSGETLITYPNGKKATIFTVPSSVKTIGSYAFASHPALQKLILSEGVVEIRRRAFFSCKSLTEIQMPSTLTTIDPDWLYDGKNMQRVDVADGNANYKSSVDGVLFNNDLKELLYFPAANSTTYTVPEGVETIKENAFMSASVTSVTLPETIKTIEKNAFNNCRQLKNINIPEGVTTIEDLAFSYCTALTSLTIPSTAVNLGEGIIANCSSLEKVDVTEGNPNYRSDDGVLYNNTAEGVSTILLAYPTGKKDTTYDIPTNKKFQVEYIAARAFTINRNIQTIEIPNTVKAIGEFAFTSCSNLSNLTFEEVSQLETIGKGAFGNLAIETLTLPASVKTMDISFYSNSKLKEFIIPDNAALEDFGMALQTCTALERLVIGDNVKFGMLNGFQNDTALKEVVIGKNSGITQIASSAFKNCTSLESITFGEGSAITTISQRAFEGCSMLRDFIIPPSVTNIGRAAFTGSSLERITFAEPASISRINSYAFEELNELQSVILPEGLREIYPSAFYQCNHLTEMNVPSTVTYIGANAFRECADLQNIFVEEANTKYASIDGILVSKDMKKLLEFPCGRGSSDYTLIPIVETIGSNAFYYCQNLEHVAIPGKVTTIEKEAFYHCDNLKSMTLMGEKVPTLGNDALKVVDALSVLYVRKALADEYPAADGWKDLNVEIHPSFIACYDHNGRQNENDNIEYLPVSDETVALVDDQTGDGHTPKTTLIIPEQVSETYKGTTKQYATRIVYDDAFRKNNKLWSLTFLGQTDYLGTNAFSGSANLKDIYFVDGTVPQLAEVKYGLDDTRYNAFKATQNIYVKESAMDGWKTAMQEFADQIQYQIPAATKNKAATLCREFDVQFNGNGDIQPYVLNSYSKPGEEDFYLAYAVSVDDGYVPAFEGIIMYNKEAAEGTSWYQIAETQSHTAVEAENYMHGLYEDTWVEPAEGSSTNFVFQGGTFHRFLNGGTMNAFRSYMQLPVSFEEAKAIELTFLETPQEEQTDDTQEEEITQPVVVDRIDISQLDADDSEWYTLSGVRVAHPAKPGIYLKDGRKVVVR